MSFLLREQTRTPAKSIKKNSKDKTHPPKKNAKKLNYEHYVPTSDEIRAAYYMLTHKTIRGKNMEIRQALQELIKSWEIS